MEKLWDRDTNHCPTQHSCCQGKTFGKNHPFVFKNNELEVEGDYLNIKATMKMPTGEVENLLQMRILACTVARQRGLTRATKQVKGKDGIKLERSKIISSQII